MAYVDSLLNELRDASKRGRSEDPFSFPEDSQSKDYEEAQPVCFTFTEGEIVNIYRVTDGINPDQYIYSTHENGGAVSRFDGPYVSLEAARKEFDPVEEGWTDY